MTGEGPVFVAGIDRTGIGLVGEILDAHPRISISRRTRFWSLYAGRLGDLSDPVAVRAAVAEMSKNRRIADLGPDPDRIETEMAALGANASDADLFRVIQEHHAERRGKARWGDKSLDAEGHAATILGAYPDAAMVHVVRDPRDRHVSYATHRGESRGGLGAATALWRWSARLAAEHTDRWPDRYLVVRYEDLVAEPDKAITGMCRFLGEEPDRAMFEVSSVPAGVEAGEATAHPLTQESVGRHLTELDDARTAYVEALAGTGMQRLGYAKRADLGHGRRARLLLAHGPRHAAGYALWRLGRLARRDRPRDVSARRLVSGD
ncbi:MAG: sulfotransferase [Actinomycetota bacterium]